MPTYRRQPVDVVIDVRSHLEFWLGHLKGAICIPGSALPEAMSKHPEIAKDARILVYCASGARSATAVGMLRAQGYRSVTDAGGISKARESYEA